MAIKALSLALLMPLSSAEEAHFPFSVQSKRNVMSRQIVSAVLNLRCIVTQRSIEPVGGGTLLTDYTSTCGCFKVS